MKYTVKNGAQNLLFEGVQLSHSSSFVPGKSRWIEFSIYRTLTGQYVVSRVGRSLVYHHATCPTVKRNRIDPLPEQVLPEDMVACDICHPDRGIDEILYPEISREAATSCFNADGVVKWMKQKDENGINYLTNVAKDALEDAAEIDPEISRAFYTERID